MPLSPRFIDMVSLLFPYYCLQSGYERKGTGRQTIFCFIVFYNVFLSKTVAISVKLLDATTLCLASRRPRVRGLDYLCYSFLVFLRKAFVLFHSFKKQSKFQLHSSIKNYKIKKNYFQLYSNAVTYYLFENETKIYSFLL